jgi:hypothetical protein
MKINTAGSLLLVLIASAGLIAGSLSLLIKRDVSEAEILWQGFDAQRSEKVRALDALYTQLGYGGMIHHLKNLVLRQYDEDRVAAMSRLGGAKAALLRYASLGVSDQERRALDALGRVLDDYTEAIEFASEHVLLGRLAIDLDPVVRVDDTPAFAALNELRLETGDSGECVIGCKLRLLADMHRLRG